MVRYMIKRSYYIPDDEVRRAYGYDGEKLPADYLFESDYDDEDTSDEI